MVKMVSIVLAVFRMVLIPVQFSDQALESTDAQLLELAVRAQDYYNAQAPALGMDHDSTIEFTLLPRVTLSRKLSYYGSNYSDRKDVLVYEAVREALRLSLNAVDFSDYDNDGDEIVDNVHIICAGGDESAGGEPDSIWPHHDILEAHGGRYSSGGVSFNSYTIASEFCGAGVICHELGHQMGLSDLYDSDGDGSGGLSPGLRCISLMDWGCRNDQGNTPPNIAAPELDALGKGTRLEAVKGSHTLEPVNVSGEYIRIPGEQDGEYFLLECRDAQGWDSHIGGSGLVVYYVDKSSSPAGWSDILSRELSAAERWKLSQVNCNPEFECIRPLTGPDDDASQAALFFPGNGYSSIGQVGGPELRSRNGRSTTLAITNIRRLQNGSVSFEIREPIIIRGSSIYQDGATLRWSTDLSPDEILEYRVNWGNSEGSFSTTAGPGSRSCEITGLRSQGAYSASVSLVTKTGMEYRDSLSFITKFYRQGSYPYIYLGSGTGDSDLSLRGSDGSFIKGARIPLKIYNAPELRECEWYFDGRRTAPDADGYFELSVSGTLEARLIFEDGHREIIRKELSVR